MKQIFSSGITAVTCLLLAVLVVAPAAAQLDAVGQGDKTMGAIGAGSTVNGELTALNANRWTFQGSSGEVVSIAMRSTAFDTYLELYDPDGNLLAFNDDAEGTDSSLNLTLEASGTYTIRARSFANAGSGEYTLSLEVLKTTVINADDFDTYPGGYRVTVNRYEIDTQRRVVRLFFMATASQTDLRTPDGTYLQTPVGNIAPLDAQWTSSGRTLYTGWFDFDAQIFDTATTLNLIYCGCGLYSIPLTDLRPYLGSLRWDITESAVVAADDFDTYPGGYRVTVNRYEIDAERNVVRLFFTATASQTDLRTPDGTYLQTPQGNIAPLDARWTSSSRTFYQGWFDFDAQLFDTATTLNLIYCGCGLYSIPLTDLRPYFS